MSDKSIVYSHRDRLLWPEWLSPRPITAPTDSPHPHHRIRSNPCHTTWPAWWALLSLWWTKSVNVKKMRIELVVDLDLKLQLLCRTFLCNLRLDGGCGARRLTFGTGRSLIFWNSATGTMLSMAFSYATWQSISEQNNNKMQIQLCTFRKQNCRRLSNDGRLNALALNASVSGAQQRLAHTRHQTPNWGADPTKRQQQ